MAARPLTPAPRSRLARTVSAWSSAVWPVAASGPEGGPPGPPGPGLEVRAVGDHHPLGPEGGPEAGGRRRPPHRPRRPTRRGARGRRGRRSPRSRRATARTNRASESAPPETPHTSAVPGAGKVQRPTSRSGRLGQAAGHAAVGTVSPTGPGSAPTREIQADRVADLDQGRQPLGTPPGPVQELGAARAPRRRR